MNIKIHPRNLDLLKSHEKLIDRQCAKIRKMLPTFAPETVDIDVSLAKLPRGSQFQTGLVLTLPQRVIKVEEIENNPTTSLVHAFGELRRRVERFKSQLNREKLWHKQPLPTASTIPLTRWEVESEANAHLEKLENYIRREVFHLVIQGELPPGVLEPQALVDDVFLFVTSRPEGRPEGLTIEQWMFQVARTILHDHLEEIDTHREEPHMEEEAEEQKQWEDEDLDFYQPDESMHLEDLLRDGSISNPEQLLEREETEAQLQRAIAALPASIRESFVLFALEGFTSDEVAMMTGKEPQEILDEVEHAREALRRDLKA
ncbi:MAG: sigma-70 family RNA polymerase sigma factor [Acidobacteriota bacterium]|jgi:RNA polymerase sigma factor (sigma-70 family)